MLSKIHLTLNAAPPLQGFALLKQNGFWVGLSQARLQSINTSNFANGIYNLAIVCDGKHIANKKLVINH